ncbi:MAG TPA: radical SAM protein [Kiritimatiellia bacterium]|jgi:23S rRNA (adenine2503-C2)-methyltransferase
MSVVLKDCTAAELAHGLAPAGVSAVAARKLHASAIRHGVWPGPEPGLSRRTIEAAQAVAEIPHLEIVDRVTSPVDGFTKYLFRGAGAYPFEAVRIPLLHRADDPKYVVCVSSQVGCSLGCVFCATAKLGLRRNLAAWEMVDQVVKIQAESRHPVRGVVFMGMGEPMMNYEAVIRAARILSEPCGPAIAAKAISISTAGIIPGIRRFTAEGHPYRLVVSLTSADPQRRRELMPVEEACPTPDLVQAMREYHAATGRRVMVAWVMISGVNTREEDARQLAELFRGLPIQLDLIDVNDAEKKYLPPSDAERNAFRDALSKHLGMPVARRYSGGQDVRAGCGMLAGT